MTQLTHAQAEHELTQVVARFEHWRQHRNTRAEPIPAALWEQAVALTTTVSRSRGAKALRVSWRDLYQHCATPPPALVYPADPPQQRFVEVPAVAAWPPTPAGTTIELHRPDGAGLRITVHEPQVALPPVVRTFLETSVCSS